MVCQHGAGQPGALAGTSVMLGAFVLGGKPKSQLLPYEFQRSLSCCLWLSGCSGAWGGSSYKKMSCLLHSNSVMFFTGLIAAVMGTQFLGIRRCLFAVVGEENSKCK